MSEPRPSPDARQRRGRFWREQLRITWHLSAVLFALALAAVIVHWWSWLTSTPPRVVRLSGSHYQMGVQHGRLLASEIRELFHTYVEDGLVAREGFPKASLIASARRFEHYIPEGLRNEMRGIADGSRIPYERILVLTPSLLRLRQVLESAGTVDAAVTALGREPRTMAVNLLVAGGFEDRAVVLEQSGRRQALVPLTRGQVVTTNFYQALNIAGGVGSERSATLAACLRRTGPRTRPADLRQALAEVAFPGLTSGLATIQSVGFLPRELTAEVAIGHLPASAGRFFAVRLPPQALGSWSFVGGLRVAHISRAARSRFLDADEASTRSEGKRSPVASGR